MSLFQLHQLSYTKEQSNKVSKEASEVVAKQKELGVHSPNEVPVKLHTDYTGVGVKVSAQVVHLIEHIWDRYPTLRTNKYDPAKLAADVDAATSFQSYGLVSLDAGRSSIFTSRILNKQAQDQLEGITKHIFELAEAGNPEAVTAKLMLEREFEREAELVDRSQAKADRKYEEGAADLKTYTQRLDEALRTIDRQSRMIAHLEHQVAIRRGQISTPLPETDEHEDRMTPRK